MYSLVTLTILAASLAVLAHGSNSPYRRFHGFGPGGNKSPEVQAPRTNPPSTRASFSFRPDSSPIKDTLSHSPFSSFPSLSKPVIAVPSSSTTSFSFSSHSSPKSAPSFRLIPGASSSSSSSSSLYGPPPPSAQIPPPYSSAELFPSTPYGSSSFSSSSFEKSTLSLSSQPTNRPKTSILLSSPSLGTSHQTATSTKTYFGGVESKTRSPSLPPTQSPTVPKFSFSVNGVEYGSGGADGQGSGSSSLSSSSSSSSKSLPKGHGAGSRIRVGVPERQQKFEFTAPTVSSFSALPVASVQENKPSESFKFSFGTELSSPESSYTSSPSSSFSSYSQTNEKPSKSSIQKTHKTSSSIYSSDSDSQSNSVRMSSHSTNLSPHLSSQSSHLSPIHSWNAQSNLAEGSGGVSEQGHEVFKHQSTFRNNHLASTSADGGDNKVTKIEFGTATQGQSSDSSSSFSTASDSMKSGSPENGSFKWTSSEGKEYGIDYKVNSPLSENENQNQQENTYVQQQLSSMMTNKYNSNQHQKVKTSSPTPIISGVSVSFGTAFEDSTSKVYNSHRKNSHSPHSNIRDSSRARFHLSTKPV